ncbi:MAG: hypothetical protein P4L50_28620 [Anaerolineaceae bacterium]|nr:hypothetical protein [Anaerolineaceae bacterium]
MGEWQPNQPADGWHCLFQVELEECTDIQILRFGPVGQLLFDT